MNVSCIIRTFDPSARVKMEGKSPSSSILAASGSGTTNMILTTLAAALAAGISAYCITKWNKEECIVKDDTESVLLEQLSEIRRRLNELERTRKKKRRTSRCSLSFMADEREVKYVMTIFISIFLFILIGLCISSFV